MEVREIREVSPILLPLLREMQEQERKFDEFSKVMSDEELLSYLKLHVSSGKVFVAFEEGRPIGVVMCRIRSWRYSKLSKVIFVSEIFVSERFRGKGVGKALMRCVFEYGSEKGVDAVVLDVHHRNEDAKRFYEALGFKPYYIRMLRLGPWSRG